MMRSYQESAQEKPLPTGELLVPPDLLLVPFSLTVEELEPPQAVAHLRPLLRSVEERIAGLGARLIVRNLHTTSFHGDGKSISAGPRTALSGVVELTLPEGGAMERAMRAATLDGYLRALTIEGRKQRPAVTAAIGASSIRVRDPEAHRGELVSRWQERARQVIEAARAAGASLEAWKLEAPGAVEQEALSLEQVKLTLAIRGGASFG
ncbi:MAG: hypothetical protein MUF64_17890 [Polyangiaceae bacterium]|jgi:hypothetical protein|nr:hypothetical protein [Polyangiaceae bacterium]